jgi:hypothetical protein
MAFIYSLTDTWADAGVTFTAIRMNVQDTASNAASLLMDLQVGGVSRFNVAKNGTVTCSARADFGDPITVAGVNAFRTVGLVLGNTSEVNWRSASTWSGGSVDLILARDAANTLAQRNGTNAQTLRVYNTFTDASNFSRLNLSFSGTEAVIDLSRLGTGSFGNIKFNVGGASALSIVNSAGRSARLPNTGDFSWANSGNSSDTADTSLTRVAAGIVGIRAATSSDGAAVSLIEQTAPAAPATNGVYIYAEDNGSGKTRLMARFATGAAVQIAIEP